MIIDTTSKEPRDEEVLELYHNSTIFQHLIDDYMVTDKCIYVLPVEKPPSKKIRGSLICCSSLEDLKDKILTHNCSKPDILTLDDTYLLRVAYLCSCCHSVWHVQLSDALKSKYSLKTEIDRKKFLETLNRYED